MTNNRSNCLRRLTTLAAVLTLLALLVAVGHHHSTESSAEDCPICTFPMAMMGIFEVVVIAVVLAQTALMEPRQDDIVRSLYICWTAGKRGPPPLL